MKKILVLITVIVLMLSMVGCTSSDDFVIEEFSILDITDTGCIIAPISDTGEVLAVHKYSIQNIFNKNAKIDVGDKIIIKHGVEELTTHPAQFAKIYFVRYVDKKENKTIVFVPESYSR